MSPECPNWPEYVSRTYNGVPVSYTVDKFEFMTKENHVRMGDRLDMKIHARGYDPHDNKSFMECDWLMRIWKSGERYGHNGALWIMERWLKAEPRLARLQRRREIHKVAELIE